MILRSFSFDPYYYLLVVLCLALDVISISFKKLLKKYTYTYIIQSKEYLKQKKKNLIFERRRNSQF